MLRHMEEGRMGIVGFTCTSYAAQRDRVILGLIGRHFKLFSFFLLWFLWWYFFSWACFPLHVLHLYGVYPRPTHACMHAFSHFFPRWERERGGGREGGRKQMSIDYSAFFSFSLLPRSGASGAQKDDGVGLWSWTGADDGRDGWAFGMARRGHHRHTYLPSYQGICVEERGGWVVVMMPAQMGNLTIMSCQQHTNHPPRRGAPYLYPFLTLTNAVRPSVS
ncbi:hypothetical protein B0T18DRAFT_26394 [Schizothecium vesticola]|uniref:Uncharacterized protein n=1 Tax=Schizothecium vesticola TaxID=314040 RepID=A0AA40FA08_9PEZI|nr:hypothetical protein B0T18DRAFT_26394 [Schizothecium vesticola]